MNKYALPLVVLSLAIFALSGCSAGKDDKTGKSGKTERPAVAVDTLSLAPSELIEGVDVTGSVSPKFETEVKSQIPGIIREVYVTEWVGVKKNAPLARIDVGETEAMVKRAEAAIESAKADLMQAQAEARRAEREKTRTRQLVEIGLATRQSFQDAETGQEAANARAAAAGARVGAAEAEFSQLHARLAKGLLLSPMDGTVSMRDVNVGDFASDVAAGKPLFKIVDNRIMKITVTVPSVEMAKIKTGDILTFSVDAFPDKVFSGRVMYINPSVEEADRSVKVIAEVLNASGRLKGGLFASGRIVTGVRKNVLQAPRSALIGFNVAAKKAALYVIKDGMAQYREVATGAIADDRVEITSGATPGEQIVVRGAFNLKDGDKVIAAPVKADADAATDAVTLRPDAATPRPDAVTLRPNAVNAKAADTRADDNAALRPVATPGKAGADAAKAAADTLKPDAAKADADTLKPDADKADADTLKPNADKADAAHGPAAAPARAAASVLKSDSADKGR